MDNVKVEALRKVKHSSPTAEALLTFLAIRERPRDRSDMRRIKVKLIQEGFEINETDYWKAVKDLAATGVGKIRYSPRGRIRHFEWEEPVMAVGQAAFEGNEIKRSLKRRVRRIRLTRPTVQTPVKPKENVVIVMPLENGGLLRYQVPDMSPADLERFTETLKQVKGIA